MESTRSTSVIKEAVRALCEQAIAGWVFPGCSVGFIRNGQQSVVYVGHTRWDGGVGRVQGDTGYDVASVTKSIPTACIALKLIENGQLHLDDQVMTYLPELGMAGKEEILIRHLLTYTVGIDLPEGLSEFALKHQGRTVFELLRQPLGFEVGAEYHYTNPPALLLGLVCERVAGKPLSTLAEEWFFGPLGMKMTRLGARAASHVAVAPSEQDWRGTLVGEIHDESAWVLAKHHQVTGHAGLFTTAGDLLKFCNMLLGEGTYRGHEYFKPATVKMMHTNYVADIGASAALGWELNNSSFMGSRTSDEAFGKTGFQACMVVIDPIKKAAVVHLSNANFPKRAKDGRAINEVRRALCDVVFAD